MGATDTTTIVVQHAPNEIGSVGYSFNAQRRREVLDELASFFRGAAGGAILPGDSVSISQTAGETAAQATGTISLSSFVAGDGVLVEGVLFVGIANTDPGPNQFLIGANDTATAVNLAAQINASKDARISGVLSATSASAVVTVTSIGSSRVANSISLSSIGAVGLGNVAYSSSSGAQTVVLNGVTVYNATGASDAANAAAAAAAINSSANALVQNLFVANTGTSTHAATCYIYSLAPGVFGNTATLSVTGTGATASGARLTGAAAGHGGGTQAAGTVTISSGSGTISAIINGITISVTWTTSDNNTATLLATAINSSTNALVQGVVYANSANNVCTISADASGPAGNQTTLSATGTGATASGARLTGGAGPTVATVAGGTPIPGPVPSVMLHNGVGGEQAQTLYQF